MTYHISSLFPLFCLLFVFAVVSLHDPFRGELGKNAVAKSTSEQCAAPAVQESLCNCPEHEITAHRRQSVQSADYLQSSERGASLLCLLFLPW